ncbi:extracellular solute-binding protein [Halalkalibacter akibai]|uniref:Extracellular solute-binding protein n=1 Tax=Halalkalibacter akibai (strain ATCC 43226 / DSM 21942 / CIP 109018 / JCM 9157 / 1139) TaxID=1236973 RepID=W4QNT8_HALA3|nr:hypothetical protein JCM9157_574 [Halalkalibacter akibai JCM 9157]
MFKKSYLFIVLVLSLLLVFAACSNNSETNSESKPDADSDSTETSKEPVTYHLFNAGAAGKDLNTNETTLGKKFEEETGVNFRLEHLVGDLNQKIGVMVAGGNYPDVIVPDAGIDTLLDAGAFIPLNDLLEEHGQNILKAYEEYLPMFTSDDGNIYIILSELQ